MYLKVPRINACLKFGNQLFHKRSQKINTKLKKFHLPHFVPSVLTKNCFKTSAYLGDFLQYNRCEILALLRRTCSIVFFWKENSSNFEKNNSAFWLHLRTVEFLVRCIFLRLRVYKNMNHLKNKQKNDPIYSNNILTSIWKLWTGCVWKLKLLSILFID